MGWMVLLVGGRDNLFGAGRPMPFPAPSSVMCPYLFYGLVHVRCIY
jgi:hypothetical protein